MPFKNILIVGGGALGGITAAVLTKEGENVVVLDTDKEHVEQMRNGLSISGIREMKIPVNAMLPEDFKGNGDIVLLCVKGLYTQEALATVLPLTSKDAPIVSFQNGVNEELIAKMAGEERTIGCIVLWGATNEGPGCLVQTSTGGFVVGKWPRGATEKVRDVSELLSKVASTDVSNNIIGHLWSKLLINASMTGVSTIAGLSYGGVIGNGVAKRIAVTVMAEVYEVGKAAGVDFEQIQGVQVSTFMDKKDYDTISKIMEYGFKDARKIKPSMLQDIEKGRRTEVDFTNGYIVKKGKEVGVKTPANELVTNVVKQAERGKRPIGMDSLQEFENIRLVL